MVHLYDREQKFPSAPRYHPAAWNDFNEAAFDGLLYYSRKAIVDAAEGKTKVRFSDVAHLARISPEFNRNLRRTVGPGVQIAANCYAYAMGDDGNPLGFKPQPGDVSGHVYNGDDKRDRELPGLIESDGARVICRLEELCEDEYPIALAIDPGNDYHFYRRDRDGLWSHKPGHLTATNRDADGKPIRDPEHINRDYGEFNYKKFAGYFAVPSGGLKVGVPVEQRAGMHDAGGRPEKMHRFMQDENLARCFTCYDLFNL